MSVASKDTVDFETGEIPFLQIKTSTWNKETFGMFDYEVPPKEVQKFNLLNSFHLYRKESNNTCYISTKRNKTDTLLLNVLQNNENFYIGTNSEFKNNYYDDAVWRDLKDYPTKNRYSNHHRYIFS